VRTPAVAKGRFGVTLAISRKVRRARVALRFAGDSRYLPRTLRVTARR
jgi:hypothetical protein